MKNKITNRREPVSPISRGRANRRKDEIIRTLSPHHGMQLDFLEFLLDHPVPNRKEAKR